MNCHYIINISTVDNWPSGLTPSQKEERILKAERFVEGLAKDYFYPKNFTLIMDGNGKSRLYVPVKPRILSINQLSINAEYKSTIDLTGSNNIEGTKGDYTIKLHINTSLNAFRDNYIGIYDYSKSEDRYWGCRIISNTLTDGTGKSVFTLEEAVPETLVNEDTVSIITNWRHDEDSVFSTLEGGIREPGVLVEPISLYAEDKMFVKGENNIRITGSYGYYNCPQAIRDACVILVQYEIEPERYETYFFKSENLSGAYSYDRGNEKMLSGIIEVDQLLRNYINKRLVLC